MHLLLIICDHLHWNQILKIILKWFLKCQWILKKLGLWTLFKENFAKKEKSLNTQGESEHKENKLKYVKGLDSFMMGLPPIQGH